MLKALHEMYPKASIFVLVKDEKIVREHFSGADVRATWLQKLPGMPKAYKAYLALMPKATESIDLKDYDLVISDSSAFAKGVITKPQTKHISLIHTPTRYLWGETGFYLKTAVPWLYRPLLSLIIPWLRRWDSKAAQRPDILLANSKEIQRRIKLFYNRDSKVVYPFVNDRFINAKPLKRENFYLISGRIVPYKRYDIVIKAFLKNKKRLVVAGSGYGLKKLRKLAKNAPNIDFRGRVSDETLLKLCRQAKALIFPALEDFGIVPLEAQAVGTPVICYGKGGSLETVINNKTGVYFNEQTTESLLAALERFERFERFERGLLRRHALQFSKKNFILAMRKEINGIKGLH